MNVTVQVQASILAALVLGGDGCGGGGVAVAVAVAHELVPRIAQDRVLAGHGRKRLGTQVF